MPKYGRIENGELITSNTQHEGFKPLHYAMIPQFNQETHAVYQEPAVDEGEYITVGVRVVELELDDEILN